MEAYVFIHLDKRWPAFGQIPGKSGRMPVICHKKRKRIRYGMREKTADLAMQPAG